MGRDDCGEEAEGNFVLKDVLTFDLELRASQSKTDAYMIHPLAWQATMHVVRPSSLLQHCLL